MRFVTHGILVLRVELQLGGAMGVVASRRAGSFFRF